MNYKALKSKFEIMPVWLKWIYYIIVFQTGLLICFWLEVPIFL